MSRTVVILLLLLLVGVYVITKSGVFNKQDVPPRYSIQHWLPFWPFAPDKNDNFILGILEYLLECSIAFVEYLIILSLKCWHILVNISLKTMFYIFPDSSLSLRTACTAGLLILVCYLSWKFCKNLETHSKGRNVYPCSQPYEYDTHPDTQSHWKCNAFYAMLGFLIISYVWEFIRIYQIERAKKATVLFKGLPLACQPDVMSWWQTLKTWTLSLVSWDQQDPCEKYHLALLVDPVWDVTPPVVLTSVFTRWFTDLMPQFSSAIGQSFQQLFGKLPIQWQPIVFVFGVVLIVLLMLMSCGYRISSPFLGIEHGSHGKRTNISCCCQNQQAAIMDH